MYVSCKNEGKIGHWQGTKWVNSRKCKSFCCNGRIRTCEPLLPKQVQHLSFTVLTYKIIQLQSGVNRVNFLNLFLTKKGLHLYNPCGPSWARSSDPLIMSHNTMIFIYFLLIPFLFLFISNSII